MYTLSVHFCAFFAILNPYNKAAEIKPLGNGTTESVIERPDKGFVGIHGEIQRPVHRRYEFLELRRPKKQKFGPQIRQKKLGQAVYNFDKLDVFAARGEENYYEPYAQSGQWVFTRPMDKNFMYQYTFEDPTQTTRSGNMTDTKHRFCPVIFEVYGKVCGRKLDSWRWRYFYKEFNNLCELNDENVREKFNRPHWFPIHSNECKYESKFEFQWSRRRWIDWYMSSIFYYANNSPHTVPYTYFKPNRLFG